MSFLEIKESPKLSLERDVSFSICAPDLMQLFCIQIQNMHIMNKLNDSEKIPAHLLLTK